MLRFRSPRRFPHGSRARRVPVLRRLRRGKVGYALALSMPRLLLRPEVGARRENPDRTSSGLREEVRVGIAGPRAGGPVDHRRGGGAAPPPLPQLMAAAARTVAVVDVVVRVTAHQSVEHVAPSYSIIAAFYRSALFVDGRSTSSVASQKEAAYARLAG